MDIAYAGDEGLAGRGIARLNCGLAMLSCFLRMRRGEEGLESSRTHLDDSHLVSDLHSSKGVKIKRGALHAKLKQGAPPFPTQETVSRTRRISCDREAFFPVDQKGMSS